MRDGEDRGGEGREKNLNYRRERSCSPPHSSGRAPPNPQPPSPPVLFPKDLSTTKSAPPLTDLHGGRGSRCIDRRGRVLGCRASCVIAILPGRCVALWLHLGRGGGGGARREALG